MTDRTERPLPAWIDRSQVVTVRGFLEDVGWPAQDMSRAVVQCGRAIFDRYRKVRGRDPYTLRMNGNGPVKVYEEADWPLMGQAFRLWSARDRAKQTSKLK